MLFLLLIYIDEKFPLFIPCKEEILVHRNVNFFAREEDPGRLQWALFLWMFTWSRFPPFPIHMCPPEPDSPPISACTS